MSKKETRVITPTATVSYPHLATAQPPMGGVGKAKFAVTLVFAPGTDLSEMYKAAEIAAEEKFPGKSKAMIASGALRMPFRKDAIAKGYADGSIFINARSEQQPAVVTRFKGTDGKPVAIPQDKIRDEVYAGSQARASVSAFGYDSAGNKGVSFALNNLQKVGDGPRIDGRAKAKDEFTADLTEAPSDLERLLG